ncbi:DUF6716 putative glycosyltransferase [Georgenia alba]|uniref:DUF6716 putative glycosyltransferase n=1 Tax=Georgenia alba TaxID=2233858 RepID=A0ABW2Q698_9MICO
MVSVLAVVDSDSYLKWACTTLDRLPEGAGLTRSVAVVRSPLMPSADQVAAAVAGTAIGTPEPVGVAGLGRLLARRRPDVVLVAATGPVAEMIARVAVRSGPAPRPALVSGLPGIALPASATAVRYRRWTDAFVVHSRTEAVAYRDLFDAHGPGPRIVLTRLPFLADPTDDPGPVRRVVFAPQSLVPSDRADRVRVLDGLARVAAAGYEVLVKLRARAGERQTHNEAYPYDALWSDEHRDLGHPADAVTFVDGPMGEWLRPGTALVTVSSTAALESMALGLPTVLLDDFGVSETLLNEPFAGSGCLATLADVPELLARGGRRPDPGWLELNYLHGTPSELPAAIQDLAADRTAGRLEPREVAPVSWVRLLRTVARSAIPVDLARRFARRPA